MLSSSLDCDSFVLPSEHFVAFSSRVSVFFVSWSFRSVSCSLFLFLSGFYTTDSQLLLPHTFPTCHSSSFEIKSHDVIG